WLCCLFFFSSRRRHTRFKCDWSSDVCSSDLEPVADISCLVRRQSCQNFLGRRSATISTLSHAVRAGCPRPARSACIAQAPAVLRSEERRVGKEGRSGWSPVLANRGEYSRCEV